MFGVDLFLSSVLDFDLGIAKQKISFTAFIASIYATNLENNSFSCWLPIFKSCISPDVLLLEVGQLVDSPLGILLLLELKMFLNCFLILECRVRQPSDFRARLHKILFGDDFQCTILSFNERNFDLQGVVDLLGSIDLPSDQCAPLSVL